MRRASKLLLVFGLLFAASALHAGAPKADVPGWVKDLAAQPVGTYPPRTDAVVLLDEATITVISDSEYVQTSRWVVRILRPEGRTAGHLGVSYQPGEKVLNLHAWTIDASGHQYELKEKDFVDASPWGDSSILYDDGRGRYATAPAADAGSVVAFEYSIRRKPLIAQDAWVIQTHNPVKESRYTLELPSGWEFKTAWFQTKPLDPVSVGANRWQWTWRDVPGIERERLQPALESLAARMSVAFFKSNAGSYAAHSWESIGLWDNSLTNGRRNVTPEIADKVRQLTAGLSTFDEKIKAIARFIQTDIRYVAIEIGIGGVQPHYAADVFKNRYGDCKDMSTLMGAMLESAGIRSYYVSIDSRHGVVDPNVPFPFFNHSIIAIEIPPDSKTPYRSVVTAKNGKKYLIFDSTDHFTPIGDIGSYLQGNAAMLSTENGGEIITIPVLPPESNRFERTGKFTLNPDGTLSGEIVETRTGNMASGFRAGLKATNESERTKWMERYFGNSLNGAKVEESKIENLSEFDKELILRYKISSGKYAQNAGPLILVRPRVLGEKGVSIEWKDRKYPVDLEETSFQIDNYELAIPSDFAIDDVPEAAQIDVGFATYKSKFEVAGNRIRYHREYVVKDMQVPLAKLPDLKRLQQEIGRDENASVVLKKN